MANVLIVGGGPAGVSAALYAVRAGLETTLLYKDAGALKKAHAIANYYGFAGGISGPKLQQEGLKQAEALGVKVVRDEVQSIDYDGSLKVVASENTYAADAVVLATGAPRKTPDIPGVKALEGRGVSYCAVCDGAFFRKRPVAVVGNGDFALHEAKELLPLASSVTLLTNGTSAPESLPEGLAVDARRIKAVEGADAVSSVAFEEGEALSVDAVFIAQGVAGAADFARRTGIMMDGARIATDEDMATNVPGLFAAGDCIGIPYQIAKAVDDGMRAGTAAIKYARGLSK